MSEQDAQAVARWMLAQITDSPEHELFQSDAADHIAEHWPELTYENENGNPAIDKKVLKIFRKISEGTVVWERGARYWRLRNEHDPEGRRQAD
ncbi:hypothetical protein [Streptomyces sp. SID13726]|uniref:DUF6953 family protein n=1 Tax=Streptomyces sp. SID13726 TaxID=2706058 RepID=UPI0013BDF13E|nr:hypothetical protein [Streptomyces sp. SID13726]NEB01933.1 hypothetical protein [Streptomyces sp. SID13726]